MIDDFVPEPGARLLLFSISQGIMDRSVYDATRFAWRLNRQRAENVDIVLGCVHGIVEGVFVPKKWLDASPEAAKRNFPGLAFTHAGPKLGFIGTKASPEVAAVYIGKRVPKCLTIGQNGVRYFDGPQR